MTIKTFDRVAARAVQDEAEKALEAIATKYGLTVAQHGGTIEPLCLVAKFAFRVTDQQATETAARKAFDQYCTLFDMTPAHFGAVFSYKNSTYRVSGLNLSSGKYPIQATRHDGKVMRFSKDIVRSVTLAA